jgi:hypothetical protein
MYSFRGGEPDAARDAGAISSVAEPSARGKGYKVTNGGSIEGRERWSNEGAVENVICIEREWDQTKVVSSNVTLPELRDRARGSNIGSDRQNAR